MKVVHIITGLNNGGAEGVLYRLVTYDKKNEHIVVSLMGAGKYGDLLVRQGFTVHYLNMSPGRPSIKSLIKLYSILKKVSPDIVQTWMYHADLIGGVVAKALGIKRVFWNIRHSTFDEQYTKPSTLRIAKICGILSSWVPNSIVSCSHESIIPHTNLGYNINKFKVIENGYDLNIFKIDNRAREEVREHLGIGEYPVIGMIGRYDPQKNHDGLIRALSKVKESGNNFTTLLVGKDLNYDNEKLMELIETCNLSDNIILLGQRTDVPRVLNSLDIHILSSSFGEGFPNVIAEAMSCGIPCIATDVGDTRSIINEYGIIVQPNDTLQLANAIIEMIDKIDSEQWQDLRLKNREHIKKHYGIESMIAKYHDVWGSST